VELLIFALFSAVALACAVGVILARNPVHCAIFLLTALFAVAGLFAVLWAEFLAVVQLLVYAGGVMVLFLFVIMLVDLDRRGLAAEVGRVAARPSRAQRWVFALAAIALAVGIGRLFAAAVAPPPPGTSALEQAMRGPFQDQGAVLGNIGYVGQVLYTTYLLPFELASVLLLVAMIGAAVLARRSN
jgi:NADH-quinone oxidoreductase subunit J